MIAGSINANALLARLAALPAKLDGGLAPGLADFADRLQSLVTGDYLAGGVLQSRTGTLAASVGIADASDASGPRMALVATAPYAAFQEYGFSGTESVAAHLRTIVEAFGKPIRAGAREVTVNAYTRRVDYPPHSFMGAALDAMEDDFTDTIADATSDALEGGSS